MTVFPYLDKHSAIKIFFSQSVLRNCNNIQKITDAIEIGPNGNLSWPAVGERISFDRIREARAYLEKAFPLSNTVDQGNQESKRELDRIIMRMAHDYFTDLKAPIAGNIGIWYYFNILVFPDYTMFRWRNFKEGQWKVNQQRFFSSTRNYIGTMWWRQFFFYDESNQNPYWILEGLEEDDFVAILERVNLRGFPKLPLELGKAIVKLRQESNEETGINTNTLIRKMILELRVMISCQDLFSMTGTDTWVLQRMISQAFDNARKKLSTK